MENPGGGSLVNFPPWWGYGYFLEPHNMNRLATHVKAGHEVVKQSSQNANSLTHLQYSIEENQMIQAEGKQASSQCSNNTL